MEYMNKLTDNPIKKLAVSSGIYDCITDPYDSLKNGDNYSSVMPDLERFAKLIIQECMNQVKEQYQPVLEDDEMMKNPLWDGYAQCGVDSYVAIREHFFSEEPEEDPKECPSCGEEWTGTSCGAVECGWLK